MYSLIMYIYLTTVCKELLEILAKLLLWLAFTYCCMQEGQSITDWIWCLSREFNLDIVAACLH